MLAFLTADCVMGGNSISVAKGISNATDERVSDHFPLPISPKNTLFRLPPSTHAKSLWLYIWNCLVGNRSQHDCLLCCITCKFPLSIYLLYLFNIVVLSLSFCMFLSFVSLKFLNTLNNKKKLKNQIKKRRLFNNYVR
jgi:hypothetical protein